jgi:hypothetical protein
MCLVVICEQCNKYTLTVCGHHDDFIQHHVREGNICQCNGKNTRYCDKESVPGTKESGKILKPCFYLGNDVRAFSFFVPGIPFAEYRLAVRRLGPIPYLVRIGSMA